MLIALAILCAAFAIICGAFSATVRAWQRGGALLDRLRHGDFVMEQLVCALRSTAFFRTAPGKYGFHLHDRGGASPRDTISWVTSGTAFLPPESPYLNGLHRIVVGIEDNDDGDPAVAIRAFSHLADLGDDETDPWYVSSEVKGLDCRVYNTEEEDWQSDWEDTNSIPSLVQITLYLDPLEEYGEPVKMQRLVEIPVAPDLEKPVEMESPGQPAAPAQSPSAQQGGETEVAP